MPAPLEHLDVLIPVLPQAAWRLLIDLLKCDRGFCHAVVPYFHNLGQVTAYISRKPLHILRGSSDRRAAEPPPGLGLGQRVGRHRPAAILAVERRAAQRRP